MLETAFKISEYHGYTGIQVLNIYIMYIHIHLFNSPEIKFGQVKIVFRDQTPNRKRFEWAGDKTYYCLSFLKV